MKMQIINIMLCSLDGKIASHSHESSQERLKNQFTCSEDFYRMRMLVAQCDAVFIGAKSMETERGAFRIGELSSNNTEPEWIVFTQCGDISFKSNFWKQENIKKSIFFVSSFDMQEDVDFRIENHHTHKNISCYLGNINGLLNHLEEKKYKRIALLGGGKLNAAFWENNLVSELYLTLSPFIMGNLQLPSLIDSKILIKRKLELKNIAHQNNFVFLDYVVSL